MAETVREYLERAFGVTLDMGQRPDVDRDESLHADLGRHRVIDRLGAGGMGDVLRALDPDIGREVAAKVIRGKADAAMIAKFAREAQITGQLEHPNIVPLHEIGVAADGRLFFTMKRVDGRTLLAVLEEGDLSRARLLAAFVSICDAVGFAHTKGVIHRDLKPENVMLGTFGEVLVLDWGLARVTGVEDVGASAVALDLGRGEGEGLRTLDGAIAGTPAYMAPEQAEGRISELDQRTDIYSLGAILYQLLCGQSPYSGSTPWVVLSAVTDGSPPPPSARASDVPRELEAIALKAMERDPARRYASASALAEDVRRWLDGLTVDAARYSPLQRLAKWVSRHAVACAALAAIGLVILTMQIVQRRGADAERAASVRGALETSRTLVAAATPLAELNKADEEVRQRTLEAYLAAVGELDRARRLAPDDDRIRRRRRAVGVALARVATLGGDYGLARQAYAALKDHGATAAELRAWNARVDGARDAVRRGWRTRVDEMLAGLRAGGGHAEIDDHFFEAVRYPDAGVAQRVGAALDALSARAEAARAARQPLVISIADRNVASFATQLLGRLGLPGAARPLSRWLDALDERRLALDAARALCVLGRAEGQPAVVRALERFGESFRDDIGDLLSRLPEPDATALRAPRGLCMRARLRFHAGRHHAALSDLERALSLEKGHVGALLLRGEIRRSLGDLEGALADLDAVIESELELEPAYLQRALTHVDAGHWAESIADLDRLLALNPNSHEAHVERGKALRIIGRTAEAIRAFERALAIRTSAEALCGRGHARAGAGDHAGALLDLNHALRLDGHSAEVYYHRAASNGALGNSAQQLYDLGAALALDPTFYRAQFNRAGYYLKAGKPAEALRDVNEVIRRAPRWPRGYGRLGNILARLGRHEASAAALTTAVQLDASNGVYWLNLGNALARLERYEEAIRRFTEGIAAAPKEHRIYVSHYQVLLRLGRKDEGLELLRRARPNCPPALQAQIDETLAAAKKKKD